MFFLAFACLSYLQGSESEYIRRSRIYGVGIGKSGTHSLARMFSNDVYVAHEPDVEELITKILDWREEKITEQEITDWLLARDNELALEIDSSNPNFYLIDILLREFPDACFVLTIRDCYTWLDSFINHQLCYPKINPEWQRMRKYRFENINFAHTPSAKILEEKGLYPLESYLHFWALCNEEVIAKVPPEKLFVVRTDQIKKYAYKIADFCRLPHSCVCLERTHEFQNEAKQFNLHEIDRSYLEQMVEKHCRSLMTRFFPEIISLESLEDKNLEYLNSIAKTNDE